MSKHTPGPWNVRNDGNQYCGAVIDSPSVGNGYYASLAHAHQRDPHPIHGGGVSQQEAESNARLIAAAPELLGAAQAVTGMIELFADELRIKENADGVDRQSSSAFERLSVLRSAIAKATGETK